MIGLWAGDKLRDYAQLFWTNVYMKVLPNGVFPNVRTVPGKVLKNSQKMSGTSNTWVNTPGMQNVKTLFLRIHTRFVVYKVLTDLTELTGNDNSRKLSGRI